MLINIGKQSGEFVESIRKKKRKASVARICRISNCYATYVVSRLWCRASCWSLSWWQVPHHQSTVPPRVVVELHVFSEDEHFGSSSEGRLYHWTGQVKAHVVLTCTNRVSPSHLPVIVASDRPHCRHVPVDKIWRRTESTLWSGRWRSHAAGIYSNCSTREIIN